MITAFVAVRLLQLREVVEAALTDDDVAPPPTALNPDEWRVLWTSTERSAPPEQIPSASWAYRVLAKMGGFTGTKRTGCDTLWRGWFRCRTAGGYWLSKQIPTEM